MNASPFTKEEKRILRKLKVSFKDFGKVGSTVWSNLYAIDSKYYYISGAYLYYPNREVYRDLARKLIEQIKINNSDFSND